MIDKLEMFIAVAKEGHFGRAAAALGITQPTLSNGIKTLEDHLGVQLIFRGSRFGGLTPEGQTALDWARKIVGDTRQLREEMRVKRHGLSGQLRIAVIPTALTVAARLCQRFNAKHPKVQFTILSRTSIDIMTMLDNLEVDAGISYLDNEPMGRVSTQALYEERYMLVCTNDSSFATRKEVNWEELAGEKLCLLTPDMQNRRIINRNFSAAKVSPETCIESNSTIVLVANVESGGYLTVLPEELARFLVTGKALNVVPLFGREPSHAVGIVAPYREPHTPVLEALLRAAKRLSKAD